MEVWREIALFLSKRDLKSLLLVPHPLSRIASQLLFREVDLHLAPLHDPGRMDSPGEAREDIDLGDWHHQRSADILSRILVDPLFSNQVRSVSIYAASPDATQPLAFQVGRRLFPLCPINLEGFQACYSMRSQSYLTYVKFIVQVART